MVSLAITVIVLSLQAVNPPARPLSSPGHTADDDAHAATLDKAQRFFYNADYARAAAETQRLCEARPDDLDACELRTASLLFQIKKAFRDTGERDKTIAWSRCAGCSALMAAFQAARAQNRVGRILGGPPLSRRRPANRSGARSRPCRTGVGRLHRRHDRAPRCSLDARRWQ
jgi:hypothetical protein